MKLVAGLIVLLLVAFSLAADLFWKRWMKARLAERDEERRDAK